LLFGSTIAPWPSPHRNADRTQTKHGIAFAQTDDV